MTYIKLRPSVKRLIYTVLTTVLVIAAIPIITILSTVTEHVPEIQKAPGYMDLTYIDLSSNGTAIRLDGKWEYYPDMIINPGEFDSYTPDYITIPEMNGIDKVHYDQATYRLTIDSRFSKHIALTIPSIFMDSEVIVNGETIQSTGFFNGEPSVFPHKTWSAIHPDSDRLEIVVHMKSNGYAMPGIDGRFEIGDIETIDEINNLRISFDLVFTILPIFVGLFFLFLFIYTKSLKKYLFFGLLCFAFAMRMVMINEVLLVKILHGLPFSIGYSMKTMSVPLIVIGALRIAKEYAQKYLPDLPLKLSYGFSALYILLLILLPNSISSYITPIFLLLIMIIVSLFGVMMFIASTKPIKNGIPAYAGFISIAACSIHDCLTYSRLIKGEYILGYAFFVYVTIYTLLMAKAHSEGYYKTLKLTDGLRRALDRAEETETAFLNAQMKPHFLFNTLNTIAEYCTVDPKQAEHLIIVLAKYLRGTIDYGTIGSTVPLKKEIEHVKGYIEIIAPRFQDISFVFNIPDDLPNANIPPIVLQPLIENCVNHGIRKREGGGRVEITFAKEGESIRITVTDDGAGITPRRLHTITNFPDDTGRIGIYNIDYRLKREFGSGISIESEVGVGTKMTFLIPIATPKEKSIDQDNNR